MVNWTVLMARRFLRGLPSLGFVLAAPDVASGASLDSGDGDERRPGLAVQEVVDNVRGQSDLLAGPPYRPLSRLEGFAEPVGGSSG